MDILKKPAWFDIFVLVVAACIAVVLADVHIPYAVSLIKKSTELYGFWDIDARSSAVAVKTKTIRKENVILDSLIKVQEKNIYTDENSVAATLYERAESAGLKTSKIEIGDKAESGDHFETPVMINGNGSYGAVGRFCEAIENLPAPANIRQISCTGTGGGAVKTFIDMVLVSQKPLSGK